MQLVVLRDGKKEWNETSPAAIASSQAMWGSSTIWLLGLCHIYLCRFYTPEEFFENEKPAPFQWDGQNPSEYLKLASQDKLVSWIASFCYLLNRKAWREISRRWLFSLECLQVESPPSRNPTWSRLVSSLSTIFSDLSLGYEWVNRDDLKTAEKCLKKAGEALRAGKSVVVDNTNPSIEAREKYIALAKKQKVWRLRLYFDF